MGVGQCSIAAGRYGDKGPGKGQAVSIHVAGTAAVKRYRIIDQNRLISSGKAHRSRVFGGNRQCIRRTVYGPIVYDQLNDVATGSINIKDWIHSFGIGQRRIAAVRLGDKGPLKS